VSISGIYGSRSRTSPYQSQKTQRQTDFQDLATALNQNDLAGAQQAFSALQALRQGGPTTGAAPNAQNGAGAANPIASDLAALGQPSALAQILHRLPVISMPRRMPLKSCYKICSAPTGVIITLLTWRGPAVPAQPPVPSPDPRQAAPPTTMGTTIHPALAW
jgi:hypothetical protein